jgi:hypothetical protein
MNIFIPIQNPISGAVIFIHQLFLCRREGLHNFLILAISQGVEKFHNFESTKPTIACIKAKTLL